MKTIASSFLLIATLAIFTYSCNNEVENPAPGAITGSLTGHSECKSYKYNELRFAEADTFSCVQYLYNESSHLLTLTHINAGFNCCPEKISCEVSLSNDTIIIKESEKEQACFCLCLFDLDIEIQNLVKDVYVMKFIEPYAMDKPQLIFNMDLTENTEGEYCVVRKGNPWGY